MYFVLAGDDNNAFLGPGDAISLASKWRSFRTARTDGDARGGRGLFGIIASARYAFSIDNLKNQQFVELWKQDHGGQVPDQFEGEQWQCQRVFEAGIAKAGGIEADKLRPALEDLTIDDIKGKVHMRKCDHQGAQQGFIFKAAKRRGIPIRCPRSSPHCRPSARHRLQQNDLRRLKVRCCIASVEGHGRAVTQSIWAACPRSHSC